MSNKALRTAAYVALIAGATALSGCSSLGGLGFDRTATSSVASSAQVNNNQTIPRTLSAPVQVASATFIPPNNIGGSSAGVTVIGSPSASQPIGSVTTEDLPVLSSSANGTTQMMPAAQPLNPVVTPAAVAAAPSSNLVSVPSDAYVHVIESGESLYTIARRYDVTAQAIIQANGFSSPDKIYVGQKIVIPGRADLLAKMGNTKVASIEPSAAPTPAPAAIAPASKPTDLAATQPAVKPLAPAKAPEVAKEASIAPAQPAIQPKIEPVVSGADKFRWPISGRVITDFANSKGTGINIEAPEGAVVRAAEAGQVIYAGSGVEGYGNLILIRHPNGYVSAYAHLKDMNVVKGAVVNRGDNIGTAGKTGSVSKPQLHFELRKGATPVDPIPMLAS